MDRETFDKIQEFAQLGDEEREAYEAFINYYGEGTIEEFRERYEGHWDTDEEFADYLLSSLYDIEKTMGDLARFFDYSAFARELFMTDYVWEDGYVFRNF